MNGALQIDGDYFSPRRQVGRVLAAEWRLHGVDFVWAVGDAALLGVAFPRWPAVALLGAGAVMVFLSSRVMDGYKGGARVIFETQRPADRMLVWDTRLAFLLCLALLLATVIGAITNLIAGWVDKPYAEGVFVLAFCMPLMGVGLALAGKCMSSFVWDGLWPLIFFTMLGMWQAAISDYPADEGRIPVRFIVFAGILILMLVAIIFYTRRRWKMMQIGELQ